MLISCISVFCFCFFWLVFFYFSSFSTFSPFSCLRFYQTKSFSKQVLLCALSPSPGLSHLFLFYLSIPRTFFFCRRLSSRSLSNARSSHLSLSLSHSFMNIPHFPLVICIK